MAMAYTNPALLLCYINKFNFSLLGQRVFEVYISLNTCFTLWTFPVG